MKTTKWWQILIIFAICLGGLLLTTGCDGCGDFCESCGNSSTYLVCGTCEMVCGAGVNATASVYKCSGCQGFLYGCNNSVGCLGDYIFCVECAKCFEYSKGD